MAHFFSLFATFCLLGSTAAWAEATIKENEATGFRHITSNGLPDHKTGNFPNRKNPYAIKPQYLALNVKLQPLIAKEPFFYTDGREKYTFGIAKNGVMFDPKTEEYWNRPPGSPYIPASDWNYEAFGGGRGIGMDQHSGHVQPNGMYVYKGIPKALVNVGQVRTFIGWAADGFPIYYENSAKPSYRLKQGLREGKGDLGGGNRTGPGGRYDGQFTSDYEYIEGWGDLDECNGKVGKTSHYPQGTYYYVLTHNFPHVPRCFMGTPHSSFIKKTRPGAGHLRHKPKPTY